MAKQEETKANQFNFDKELTDDQSMEFEIAPTVDRAMAPTPTVTDKSELENTVLSLQKTRSAIDDDSLDFEVAE